MWSEGRGRVGDKAESLGTPRWRCKHVSDRPSPYLPTTTCHNGYRKQHRGHPPTSESTNKTANIYLILNKF